MLIQLCADYFHRSSVLAWPIAALALLLAVFITVTVRALLRDGAEIQELSQLPLRDGKEGDHHG